MGDWNGKMREQVYRLIEQEKLIEPGDFVLAGVSGGADSVCMLLLLLAYQSKCSYTLQAVHVEHGIRGEESRQDEAFVKALCEEHGVCCRSFAVDAPDYAKRRGIGLEEAARELRYDCYARAAKESGARRVKVALAHHADDNAETVLFQMVRGSGIRGLGGMRPMRRMDDAAFIIRPLLAVSRSEIEAYLEECRQPYRVDATNLDTEYSRNRIRHKVIPELTAVNPGAVSHITRTAGMLLAMSDYLAKETERILAVTCRFGQGDCEIGEALFKNYPTVLQKEAVHEVLSRIAGSRRDIADVHVEDVLRLSELQVGRMLDLPYRMQAVRCYEGVRIRREAEAAETAEAAAVADHPAEYEITEELLAAAESEEGIAIVIADGILHLRVRDFGGEMQEIPKKTYTKWLNYDKIKRSLRVRRRADKDYLTIDGEGHTKKLSDYFTGEKIPKERRNQIWLLAEGTHILWVVGGRISADCRIDNHTKKILEVQMSGGKYREDQED